MWSLGSKLNTRYLLRISNFFSNFSHDYLTVHNSFEFWKKHFAAMLVLIRVKVSQQWIQQHLRQRCAPSLSPNRCTVVHHSSITYQMLVPRIFVYI
jgi:hypothetical protein